jgi:hypothetical protein
LSDQVNLTKVMQAVEEQTGMPVEITGGGGGAPGFAPGSAPGYRHPPI